MAQTAEKAIVLARLRQSMERIKSQLDNVVGMIPDNLDLGHAYATCSTQESTTAKVVNLTGYVLADYGNVSVRFTYAVPANATLNINGTGAKAIYYKGSAITAGKIQAGDTATFVYDGSHYILVGTDKSADGYVVPSGGIPASDMAENVQTALALAGNLVVAYNGMEQSGKVTVSPSEIFNAYNAGKNVIMDGYGDEVAYLVKSTQMNVSPIFTCTKVTVSNNVATYSLVFYTVSTTEISGEYAVTRAVFDLPNSLSDLTNDAGFITNTVNNLVNYYTKTEIDGKIAGAFHYKGTKATTAQLPTTGNEIGDVWHVTADGSEWAWNGTSQEELGTIIDLSGYATKVSGATSGNFAGLDASGNITDSGKKASDFVAAVSGKGLSTNDFTDALKNKLDGISSQANKTTVTTAQGYGHTAQSPNVYADTIQIDSNTAINVHDANTIVGTIATESEVTSMLNEVFGS